MGKQGFKAQSFASNSSFPQKKHPSGAFFLSFPHLLTFPSRPSLPVAGATRLVLFGMVSDV
jgi:hypothetical protein